MLHDWCNKGCGTCYPVCGKEGNVLFNDALNTFYLRLYGVNIWLRTTQIAREETRCCHIGYSFQLAARVLLYASSHRQDSIYHGLCYTSRGALAGTRNSSMGPLSHHERTLLPLSYISLHCLWDGVYKSTLAANYKE